MNIRQRKLREQRDYITSMVKQQREDADDALPLYSLKPLTENETSKLVKPGLLCKVRMNWVLLNSPSIHVGLIQYIFCDDLLLPSIPILSIASSQ